VCECDARSGESLVVGVTLQDVEVAANPREGDAKGGASPASRRPREPRECESGRRRGSREGSTYDDAVPTSRAEVGATLARREPRHAVRALAPSDIAHFDITETSRLGTPRCVRV
jgi:hypothetical protein